MLTRKRTRDGRAVYIGAERVDDWDGAGLDDRERAWLQAMFDYYDRHGLPVGTQVLRVLLGG